MLIKSDKKHQNFFCSHIINQKKMHSYNISLFLLDSQQQFDGDILSSRIPLLVKYYDGNLQREAAALEAIEELA